MASHSVDGRWSLLGPAANAQADDAGVDMRHWSVFAAPADQAALQEKPGESCRDCAQHSHLVRDDAGGPEREQGHSAGDQLVVVLRVTNEGGRQQAEAEGCGDRHQRHAAGPVQYAPTDLTPLPTQEPKSGTFNS